MQRDVAKVPVLDRGGQVGAARLASTVSRCSATKPGRPRLPVTPGPAGHDEGRIMISGRRRPLSSASPPPLSSGSDLPPAHAPVARAAAHAVPPRTELTFAVQGCNGCHFRLTQALDGRRRVWQSPQHTVRNGSVTWTVPTRRTHGLSVTVLARGTAEPATCRRSRSGTAAPAGRSRQQDSCPHQAARVDLLGGHHEGRRDAADHRRARPVHEPSGDRSGPRAPSPPRPSGGRSRWSAWRGITGTQGELLRLSVLDLDRAEPGRPRRPDRGRRGGDRYGEPGARDDRAREPSIGERLGDGGVVAAGDQRPARPARMRAAWSAAASQAWRAWLARRRANRCWLWPPALVRPWTCRWPTLLSTSSGRAAGRSRTRPLRTSRTPQSSGATSEPANAAASAGPAYDLVERQARREPAAVLGAAGQGAVSDGQRGQAVATGEVLDQRSTCSGGHEHEGHGAEPGTR